MLRITQLTNAKAASQYFPQADYYTGERTVGQWRGRASPLLGLEGEVQQADFEAVLSNRRPGDSGTSITPRMRSDRRPAWDVTFTVSKSLSVLYALTGDPRVLDAIEESVDATLSEMERDALVREHQGKSTTARRSGNLLFATFLHKTARPVAGFADCALHVHAVCANLTHDGERFKAADIHLIKSDAPHYQARFESRLAMRLQDYGIATERRGKQYEVVGVSRKIIERFSERQKQVEAKAKSLGITDAKQKDQLAARTREAKQQGVHPDQLRLAWSMKVSAEERRAILDGAYRGTAISELEPAKQAVDHAIKHHFARDSVVRERTLATTAMQYGLAQVTPEQIDRELDSRELIRRGSDEQAVATTRAAVLDELEILKFARDGKGQILPVSPEYRVTKDFLSDEQKEAVGKILASSDVLQLLIGRAGVGKSTVASEIAQGVREQGLSMAVIAPTSKSVDVLRKDGFDARTLASFLLDKEQQMAVEGGVIFLDESGMVGSHDLRNLLTIAKQQGARVILAGDDRQHRSIGRGRVLDLIAKEAGIEPVEIQTIRRQSGQFRRAVEQLSRGDVAGGIQQLDRLGWIKDTSGDERFKRIAVGYADALIAGETALAIAPTHAERERLGDAIRSELKRREMLKGDDHQLLSLASYGWTDAEKQDWHNYQPGAVVEFHRKGRGGFKPGERAVVTRTNPGGVTVEVNGVEKSLPLASASSFDVFRTRRKPFAIGERIRITRGTRGKAGEPRLSNGSAFTIQGFDAHGRVRIGRNKSIAADYGHIDTAAVTSFASQATTVDMAFVSLGRAALPAASPEQLYVSASRARNKVEIYTDDRREMVKAVSHMRPQLHAVEIERKSEREPTAARNRVKNEVERLRRIGKLIRGYAYTRMQAWRQWIEHTRPQTPTIQRGQR